MRWYTRLFYACLFAIPVMLVTFALGQAAEKPSGVLNQDDQPLDCKECHEPFEMAWQAGAHGTATTDPEFRNAWEEQGEPDECLACHVTGYDPETGTWQADGIVCEACHSPVTAMHPLAPMSLDQSAKFCGDCHLETYFEWQVSQHREEGVECASCHDPHSTNLKTGSPDLVCASCHRGRASIFAHSSHSIEGLTCVDCHVGQLSESGAEGHSQRDHSFFVSLSACTSCHDTQMHDPIAVDPEQATPTPEPLDAMAAVDEINITNEPVPVSPLGFTTLAGLIGIAFGIVLAPWLERWQRELRHGF